MGTHVGIFGGTFDPVHDGHCAVARSAQLACSFSRMIWMPTGCNWQKYELNSHISHRLCMLYQGVEQCPGHEISLYEAEKGGITYTVDTVRALREDWGYDFPLTLVLGWDSFARLPTWKEWMDILNEVNLAVVPRYGVPMGLVEPVLSLWRGRQRHLLHGQCYGAVLDIPMIPLGISSSYVRSIDGSSNGYSGLLPGVAGYIFRHGLYQ